MATRAHADPQSRIVPGQARVGDILCSEAEHSKGECGEDDLVILAVQVRSIRDWRNIASDHSWRQEGWIGLRHDGTLQAVAIGKGTTWIFHDAG